jgi:hypothetical protein
MNGNRSQNRILAGASIPPPIPSIFDLLKREFDLQVTPEAPEWAKCAAELVFDSLTAKGRKRAMSEAYFIGFDSGYVQGTADALASLTPHEKGRQIAAGMRRCNAILKESWAKQPSDKAADFFSGFRDGEKLMRGVPERAQQMAQRTKLLRAIATQWKQIAPGVLQDTGQLHEWLLAQNVISPRTDSAETRLVCTKIGLRYKNPGKPRKPKM